MKRFHIHVGVDDLDQSVRFYSTLFAAGPTVLKSDYAKWALDDPRVNFAISTKQTGQEGIDHLGIELDSDAALKETATALRDAGNRTVDQSNARCCYTTSDKSWVWDPSGIKWETFHSTGAIAVYGEDTLRGGEPACCDGPPEQARAD